MLRRLYTLILWLALPLVLLRLLRRGRREPGYRRHLGERFGFFAEDAPPSPLLWIHTVSLGETRAARPLVEALLAARPELSILLTHMTATGREAGAEIARAHPGRIAQCWLPYDYPCAVRRFLRRFRPACGVLMETEVWPNLVHACAAQGVPLLLANARMSKRSARGYARLAMLFRHAFAGFAAVAAQGEGDARRLASLGAHRVFVCGNMKYDLAPPPALLELGRGWRASSADRPVWLAASTREGEEEIILAAQRRILAERPDALLVLVPRHPQRFDDVARLAEAGGLTVARRSAGLPGSGTQVWLGDSMGELPAYYAAADVALIGGSLLPFGGQNLIEAAACGCPALVGPHTFNFADAAERAIAAGAARRLAGGGEAALAAAVEELLAHAAARARMGEAGLEFVGAHRGATARIAGLLLSWLDGGNDASGSGS